ncbi:hypothetical protein GJ744_006216 [Endocarpon pusillum]|uniref:DUF1295-domain-containing protein n=1 Tax=Endocarpon pusillum TaxID=364733 RepID=A0A8H7ANF5_9EURO|nr:hypothetical protein GJ744_006216 [Endocarpon pusillum]
MALPIAKTALDCSEFSNTVTPFLHQLRPLPGLFLESATNLAALKQIYLDTNPLISAFAFSLMLSPIFLIVSEINKNYSQVDRLWSILPTLYNAHFAIYAHLMGFETKRLDTLLAASCIWSCRLTFNYWRKGGYTIGSEDYRWAILRTKISPTLFFIFNVLFISLAQSILLFSITTPTYLLLLASRLASSSGTPVEPWTFADLIFSRLMVAWVLTSFFADQQQWQFQSAKKSYQETAKVPPKFNREDLDRGFIVTGLWSWSRHPNFAAEQAFWLTLYQWSCHTTNSTYNWTGIGALSYLILFQASTWFTELISSDKYPEYKEYQARVGKFVPRLGTDPKGDWKVPGKVKTVAEKVGEEVEKDAKMARERYDLR